MTLQNIIHFLESCPNAESVRIGSPSLNEDSFSQQWSTLVCSQIRDLKLILHEEVMEPFAVLLNYLAIPALTHLCLFSTIEIEDEELSGQYSPLIDSLCSMLHRSHIDASPIKREIQGTSLAGSISQPAGVTHLSLQQLPLSRLNLLRLFDALPSVKHFEYYESLGQRSTADRMIKGLIAPQAHTHSNEDDILFGHGDGREDGDVQLNKDSEPGDEARNMLAQGCLLPNLQNLSLRIKPLNDLLIQLIESRWRSPLPPDSQEKGNTERWVCLQRVECIHQCRWDTIHTETEELRQRCQQVCDEGLKMKVSTKEVNSI